MMMDDDLCILGLRLYSSLQHIVSCVPLDNLGSVVSNNEALVVKAVRECEDEFRMKISSSLRNYYIESSFPNVESVALHVGFAEVSAPVLEPWSSTFSTSPPSSAVDDGHKIVIIMGTENIDLNRNLWYETSSQFATTDTFNFRLSGIDCSVLISSVGAMDFRVSYFFRVFKKFRRCF